MTIMERELLIYRIAVACLRCEIKDDRGKPISFLLKQPSRYQKYIAQEIYFEQVNLHKDTSYSEEELMGFLLEKNIWDEDKQGKVDGLQKDIEKLKVGLVRSVFKSNERRQIKKAIGQAKEELHKLLNIRNSYNYLSTHGIATAIKARYLIACSLYDSSGKPFMRENEFWESDDRVIEKVANIFANSKCTEEQMRELARTEPWRSTWNARKAEGSVFGIPTIDLTDEQKALCIWSGIYDSIYEHPECPSESIIDDDDALDGWMIIQKEKREKDTIANEADSFITNDKIKNSSSIFVPVGTQEDAQKIEQLNDMQARMIKRQRMAFLQKSGGVVHEAMMPDSRLAIQAELTRMFKEHTMSKG